MKAGQVLVTELQLCRMQVRRECAIYTQQLSCGSGLLEQHVQLIKSGEKAYS